MKALKPIFFANEESPFWDVDFTVLNTKGKSFHTVEHIKGKVFQEGSAKLLDSYIRKETAKENGSIAFFGDNWVTDAHAAKIHGWDGVCIIEEL